jgi:hypothetical protein
MIIDIFNQQQSSVYTSWWRKGAPFIIRGSRRTGRSELVSRTSSGDAAAKITSVGWFFEQHPHHVSENTGDGLVV